MISSWSFGSLKTSNHFRSPKEASAGCGGDTRTFAPIGQRAPGSRAAGSPGPTAQPHISRSIRKAISRVLMTFLLDRRGIGQGGGRLRVFLAFAVREFLHHIKGDRDKENGDDSGRSHAADHRGAHDLPGDGARARGQGQSGMHPRMKAKEVIRMGRSRRRAPFQGGIGERSCLSRIPPWRTRR